MIKKPIPSYVYQDNDKDILKIDEAEMSRSVILSFLRPGQEAENAIRLPINEMPLLIKLFKKYVRKYKN